MLTLLVEAGAAVNAVNRYGATPLSLAAEAGSAGGLEYLLSAGADPKAAERALPEGQTLLMLAARTGDVASLRAIVGHGAGDVNARETRNDTTALMWAALEDRADAVRFLAEVGADLDAHSKITDYPHLANGVGLSGLEEGVSYVGQTVLQRGGWTALMYAARQGAVAASRALAEVGANLDAVDPVGASALNLAIINGHWDVAEVLVNAGADPNLADVTGMTPLYAAVDFHTVPTTFGRPAPKPRVIEGSVDAVKMLLAAGADPDARLTETILKRHYTPGDNRLGEGATALMRAARGGDLVMMRILLDAGADPSLTQTNGNTPLLLAAGTGSRGIGNYFDRVSLDQAIEAVRLCLEAGNDINAVNAAGHTAVHIAATSNLGSPEMIQFLVDRGAAFDVPDKRGRTPLEAVLASRETSQDTIDLLRRLTGNTEAQRVPEAARDDDEN
jgi:ankyrin repeat protein